MISSWCSFEALRLVVESNILFAMPLRVLMVSRSLPCHVAGGLEFHVVDLAKGLAREGAEVEILSTPAPPGYWEELRGAGVALHAVDGCAPGVYSLGYFRRVGAAIRRLHSEKPYDIIHGHEFAFGFERFDSPMGGAKIVLSVHGTITTETPLHRDVFPSLSAGRKAWALARFGRRWLYAPAWRRALRRADRLLVDSEFTGGELARIDPALGAKTRLIPLGAELAGLPEIAQADARAELGWPQGDGAPPILLTIGRLEWQKGQELALRALASLRELPWRYFIAGAGREAERLQRLAGELGLQDRVEFMGRIDDRRKALALAAADLFVWPERTHPAFGLAGAEAMLMNTPVLATRRGAIPELVDARSGWLFDPSGPEALAEALAPLLKSPQMLRAPCEGLRERALAKFDPQAMARAALAAYSFEKTGTN